MLKKKFYYLIHLQYLGFRYHGWQKQPQVKTLQFMLERTLKFIFQHNNFKTLGSSRTDAMVSANHHLCELFTFEQLNISTLMQQLNQNLPADIKVLKLEEVDKDFQVINPSFTKEYHYYFSNEPKSHPYSAPYIANFKQELNISLMIEAAKLFKGTHNFKEYCYRPKNKSDFLRTIITSEISENTYLKANFFPKKTYVYKVMAQGFLHHQVRLMMGTLVKLGLEEIDYNTIEGSLKGTSNSPLGFIAPASGLHLYNIET